MKKQELVEGVHDGTARATGRAHRMQRTCTARRRMTRADRVTVGSALVIALLTAVGMADPFGPQTEYVMGDHVRAVATGHFDGNAHLDLAVATYDEVTILKGQGDGSFVSGASVAVGGQLMHVTTDHLDDDADLDLIVASSNTKSIAILLGNGDGTFAAPVHYDVAEPTWVTTGRFDDDDVVDLAVTSNQEELVSVLLGNGDGTFAPKVDVADVSEVEEIVTGYFDDDHELDLAVAEIGGVTVLLGNGDGSFAVAQPGGDPIPSVVLDSLAVGYFDDDTHLDVAGVGSGDLWVLLGLGNGGFQSPVQYPTGNGSNRVITGRFNDDSDMDVAVTNRLGDDVSVLFGNGDGTFAGPIDHATGDAPVAIAAGCFDDDTDLDLAVANFYSSIPSGSVSVLLDVSPEDNGAFAPTPQSPFPTPQGPLFLATGHFDDDVELDLAIANAFSHSLSIVLGNGDGTFGARVDYANLGGSPRSVITGHFNDDVELDLAVVSMFNHHVAILLGQGDGSFAWNGTYDTSIWSDPEPIAVTAGFFNDDTNLDLAVINRIASTVGILLGHGNGAFGFPTEHDLGALPLSVVTGEFNGDGDLDLAVTNSGSGTVSILLGNGAGSFPARVNVSSGESPRWLVAGHFNGDRNLDLAVAHGFGDSANAVFILFGNGDGTFASPVDYELVGDPRSIVAGHFNGDAQLDLAVTIPEANRLTLLFGKSDGTFGPIVHRAMPAAAGITTGHFDDDTDLDLAITNFNGGASILLGVSDFAPPTTTIARTPAQPDGANGWYVSAVGVTISADDGANGSGVVETRCDVLGPLAPVPTFDGLSAECAVSGVSVDGEHMVYAASVDALENEESPVASVSVKIDTTPPSVVPAVAGPGPVFKLDGAGSNVVANVTDATSGALAASVFGAADLSSVGNKSLLLVGSDRAGNTSTVVCPYRVSYRVIGVAPTSAVLFRGSTVPIQFRLANAAGTRISDSEAVDLISPTCKVKITLNGVAAPGCAIYKLVSDVFEYGLYLPYSLSPGAYRLGIRVNAPDGSGVVNTESVTVLIW